MGILYFLVPLALLLAGVGVVAFRWAVRDGQFDDLDSPALRVLFDEPLQSASLGAEPPASPDAKNGRRAP